jgi:hypothetical protein
MSKASATATPQAAKTPQTAMAQSAPMPCLAQEKVAMRAYEKWVKGGCKHGCDQQHWFEAEQELRAELARNNTPRR